MQMQKDNLHTLQNALGTLVDWFARLGGSYCYGAFSDIQIPEVVVILCFELYFFRGKPTEYLRELLPDDMWKNTGVLIPTVSNIVKDVSFTNEYDLYECVNFLTQKLQKKYSKQNPQWTDFIVRVTTRLISEQKKDYDTRVKRLLEID